MGETESEGVDEREKARLFFLGDMDACKAGDAGAVRDLVGAKADVNKRYVMSDTERMDACCT